MMGRAREWLRNAWKRRDRATWGAYRALFDPTRPESRIVLADLAAYCNAGVTSFVAGDPYQTALNEGRRDAYLHIAEIIGLDARDWPDVMQELKNQ